MKALNILTLVMICIGSTPIISSAQDTLPEVTVVSRNYKYLRSVDNQESSQPVKLLERKVAAFDLKNSDIYSDEYDTYYVSFYLPQGYILAAYDQDGKILHTAEHFNNVALPSVVKNAIMKKYAGWAILDDTYLVKYREGTDPKLLYKLMLGSRDKRIRIKVDEMGNFK